MSKLLKALADSLAGATRGRWIAHKGEIVAVQDDGERVSVVSTDIMVKGGSPGVRAGAWKGQDDPDIAAANAACVADLHNNADLLLEAIPALRELMEYVGGWGEKPDHPCGRAAAFLSKVDAREQEFEIATKPYPRRGGRP